MKLLDVARASLSELYSDFFFQSLSALIPIWQRNSEKSRFIFNINIDTPIYKEDWPSEAQAYILQVYNRITPIIAKDDQEVFINMMLILIDRCRMMIESKMNYLMNEFKNEGGFTEKLSGIRLEQKKKDALQSGTLKCPDCGAQMLLRTTYKGSHRGKQFWGCSNYPQCSATLPYLPNKTDQTR